MTSLGLKKDRAGTCQGSSASPEDALSCPSAEGVTVLFYRGGHFRAGCHFLNAGLSVALRAEFTNVLIETSFPDIFGLRIQCDALSNYTALVVFYSLPTSTLGHTETHPPMTVSFSVRKSGWNGHSSKCTQLQIITFGAALSRRQSRGFYCLLGLVCYGRSRKHIIFTKRKQNKKIMSLKIFLLLLFFFKSVSTFLMGCVLSAVNRTDICASGLVYVRWNSYKAVLVSLSFLNHGASIHTFLSKSRLVMAEATG